MWEEIWSFGFGWDVVWLDICNLGLDRKVRLVFSRGCVFRNLGVGMVGVVILFGGLEK